MIKKEESGSPREAGQILVIVFIALGLVLFSVLSIVTGAQIYFQNAAHSVNSEKATALAEAGVDKALTSLNKTGGSYTGEQETVLGDGSYSVILTSQDAASKVIESTGYIPRKDNPKIKRTVKIIVSKGVGASFVYGVQVGEGGLILGKHNLVTGTIYSNGNITSDEDNRVTGDVWVAGGPQPTADQQTDCEGSNCTDFLFGKTVSGETRLDIAQSFQPASSGVLNKVSIKIKKFGNPPDVTARILQDASGKPDKNAVLTQGTLYASLATGTYGWIDITFNSSPALTADTTYWLMIDTTTDSVNFWSWQNDLAQSYTRGLPKWSPSWNTGNPTWNNITGGGDLGFKTYMGGAPTSVRAEKDLQVNGSVHANTIEKITIGQDAFYQTIISSTVSGTQYPGSADSPPKVFPISDANVAEWKSQAEAGGTVIGDITNCVAILESKKIVGNLIFDKDKKCTITVKSPVWITGNLELDNKNILTLSSEYGSSSGVIVVDGTVTLDNNNQLKGIGTGSSILMVLSGYDSRSNDLPAIKIKNNGNTGVFYASTGIIEPGNGNTFKELTAWGIRLVQNSTIDYETGLSSTLFSSGPTGSYSLIKGTYQVK